MLGCSRNVWRASAVIMLGDDSNTTESAAISHRMRLTPSRDTRPEVALRRALHAAGMRYWVDARPVPSVRRTADVVFPRLRIAVFLDGCYWHGCPDHYVASKSNVSWWRNKIEGNIARDMDTNQRLRHAGWLVVRVWEHEPTDEGVIRIAQAVAARRDVIGRSGSIGRPPSTV